MASSRIFALLILFTASLLIAQEPSKTNLLLTVTDPTGAVIPNATTHVESSDHSISFGTKTDNTGQVTFELSPGNYTIKISSNGFLTTTSQVQVHSDPTQSMKVALIVNSYGLEVNATQKPIYLEEISLTTSIPLLEITAYQIPSKKLPGNHFKLMPCLVSIQCNT